MKLLFKRHCSSLSHFNPRNTKTPSAKEFQIRHLCKSGSLPDAFGVLNSIDSGEITVKPILYASLLQTCVKSLSFRPGLQIHAHVVKSGLETDRFVGNSLLALYFKLGSNILETRRVFDLLIVKDVISWTSMVTGYVRVGKPGKAIEFFWDMIGFGIEPNGFTLSAMIKACSELQDLRLGRCFHAVVSRRGFDSNHVIVSSLIDMYGRNYVLEDAKQVFDELLEPDAICWTSVISSMTRNDSFEKALALFYSMQRNAGLFPDGFTFGTVLTACGNMGRLKQGREVHSKVITCGFVGNVVVESSLVDMYGKCGSVDAARSVFDRMTVKNSVSWSALLGVYCQNRQFESVVKLFRTMEKDDLYSLGTVLRACAGLAAVRQGKEVHCQYVRRGGWRDVIVESALVDLYAKCGCIYFAHSIFIQMPVRNLITWNSMICGFAQNGRGGEAIGLFEEMIEKGIKPDYISFVGVLFACSHSGLVDQGRRYFDLMTAEYGIKAGIEHYNCMVDLLGRAGLLEEAENLIENADYRGESSLWAVILGACTTCTNSTTAERIAKKMMNLEPNSYLSYVLLANVYRAVGRWNDALKIRKLMKDRGVKKMPGKSWIETNGNLDPHFGADHLNVSGETDLVSVGNIG
ncbi:Tetratricopeptide-like helical domain containing protein [Parasponia andersonii]|uniref:Tetratricopeptide-like helical domain containing protein n=1 Tax=Parasponia andersonii TaxID=3476 RepID=A0A2P5E4X9_PARAD|nr:Tetratricopeptide-like helical domain containing protein [Parasponia andersonii]